MTKKIHQDMVFLSGDEALAQGAFEQGLKVAASYPGTPATEILEYLSKIPEVDSQWSVNEKVAFEVALSSAISGLRSIYSSKHVGLNVAMDSFMTSSYIGVNAGFIIVTCDDPGLHSSQNEQDNRLFAKVGKMPLLEPSSPREAREFVKEAFRISEAFDTPVIMRMTTRIAHTKENMRVGARQEILPKQFKTDISKYVMVPKNAYIRHIELEKRLISLKKLAERSPLNKIELNSKKIGIVTSGVTYLYAKEMYPGASFLKLGMSYPFPEALAREFSRKVKELIVVEELEPFLEEELKLCGIKARARKQSFRAGELRPEYLPDIFKGKEKVEAMLPARKPMMCPGCSHRAVFWVLKKLRLTVAGDIGCYTLGALPPFNSLHTCLCMGAAVTFFEGFKKGLGKDVVGVIGDSTFVHSGIAGLINLSYNKTKGLLLILDNGTTAMTGSQPHPATGRTNQGIETKKLVLEDLCRACGADNVDVVNPLETSKFEELVKSRVNADSLSVIIARYPCRIIDRKIGTATIFSKDKCKKCYACLAIDCPALTKTEDGFIAINTTYCTGCNLCVNACKFGALITNS